MSRPGTYRNALQVSPQRIAALNDADLNELMRHLLRAQAYRCGCPDVTVNAQVDAGDGGRDGRSAQPAKPDRWLGNTETCWQFKAGRAGEPARLAAREGKPGEINKPIPRRTLQERGRFVLVASGSTGGATGEERRRERLIEDARRGGLPAENIEVYGSEKLAEWCNQYPAIAARWSGAPEGLWTFDDWARNEEYQGAYQASRKIGSDLSAARSRLDFNAENEAESTLHVHVRGLPGVGKSRFALELCRDARWRDMVIYVRQADDIRLAELIDTAAEAPDIRLMVVADEAQPERLEPLRNSVGRAEGRVRLISIGGSPTPDPGRIPETLIEPLDAAGMRMVVRSRHPSMPPEHVNFVTDFADGYVKLGRLAADAVAREPSATLPSLLARHEIRMILDRLLGDGDRRALYVVAVLTHVGWSDDKQGEGRAIAEHLGLAWNDVRYQVDQFHNRMGIAPRGGRYRYISPEPLAIYLAHAAWETFPELLKSLGEKLPTESAQEAYYKRLRSLASNPQAREYSRDQLRGFFFRIDDFVEVHAVRRWSALSTADPALAASILRQALIASSLDDRRRITFRALGELIGRLVRIAAGSSGFHDAAVALALLAEPENESWENGASREFVARYRVSLGGTALPYLHRLEVLDELMALRRPKTTRLVVRALAQVGNDSAGAVVMPSSDCAPEPDWKPASGEQHLQCITEAIDRLRVIVAEREPELQGDLLRASMGVSRLLVYGDAGTSVATFLVELRDSYPDLREPLRKQIAGVLRRNKERLPPNQRQTLNELHARFEDPSLAGRLQQYVGPQPWEWEKEPSLRSLSRDLVADPGVLAEQWSWLTSGRAGATWRLGQALASADPGGRLAEELPGIPGGGPDQRLVCGYVAARRNLLGDEWYERWALSQFERDPQPVGLLLEVIQRCGATDRLAIRTAELLHSRKPGRAMVGRLVYSGWHETRDGALKMLLEAMVETGHQETAVGILQRRMKTPATEIDRWQSLAMNLVLDLDLIRCTEMPNHYWYELAKKMVPYHPREISAAIFRAHAERSETEPWFLQHEKEVVDVLLACIDRDPVDLWRALRPHLWPLRTAMVFVIGFPGQVLERLPMRAVLAWIAEPAPAQETQRAALLAPLTNQQSMHDDSLAARIIARYGDDEDVSDAFMSHHIGGTFEGSVANRYRDRANRLSDIAERTALPGLRSWAQRGAAELNRIAHQEQQEEEEGALLFR